MMKTTTLASLAAASLCFRAVAGQTNTPIPWDQIGARAGADYQGEGVTNPLTAGSPKFTDALATNYPRRFYRALLQP